MNACVIGFAGAFNSRIFNRHSYLRYRFFQKMHNLRFSFAVESCYYCITLILVSLSSLGFVAYVFWMEIF